MTSSFRRADAHEIRTPLSAALDRRSNSELFHRAAPDLKPGYCAALELAAVGSMRRKLYRASAAIVVPPATLTLTCKGMATRSMPDAKPERVSMGIIVNFANYSGLRNFRIGLPGDDNRGDRITVTFSDQQKAPFSPLMSSISGTIGRVTGYLQAMDDLIDEKQSKIIFETS